MVIKNEQKQLTFTYTATNETFKVPFIVKTGRMIFKVLTKISSSLSSKFATYLFFRPRKGHYNGYDLEIISKSTQYDRTINNKTVKVYTWGSSTKKALFVHGWEGKGTSGKHFIEPLLNQNYQVIAFDAPAHGKSSGKDTDLLEITNTIKMVIDDFGPFDLTISHSFGSLATLLVWQEIKFCENFIMIGSMSNPYTAIKGFQYLFNLKQKVIDGLLKNLEKRVDKPMQDFLLHTNPDNSITKMLLIHDKKDMVSPFSESISLSKIYPNSKLIDVEETGHHKILSSKITIELVSNFISH
jgi:hypothetical protein